MTATYQTMPPLAADEMSALRADIESHGIQSPVLIDTEGRVIDGPHRVQIAEELGIDYPTRTLDGLSEDEKFALSVSLNVHRRHLTREQRRELVARSLRQAPELSNRQHAERVGVDHKTVQAVRQPLEQRGEIPHVSERTDSHGRQQPARPASRPTITRTETHKVTETIDAETGEVNPPKTQPAAEPSPAFDVNKALNNYIDSDPEIQHLRAVQRLQKSITGAVALLQWEPADAANLLDEERMGDLERTARNITDWVARVRAARPTHLRLIGGQK